MNRCSNALLFRVASFLVFGFLACCMYIIFPSNYFVKEQKILWHQRPGGSSVALIAIFKNEAQYLREWIEFHKAIGINRFYLIDNNSTDNYLTVLRGYVLDGTVILRRNVSHYRCMQGDLYTETLRYITSTVQLADHPHEWVVAIDVDEFIYPVPEGKLLIDVLSNKFAQFSVVYVTRYEFCSSGHKTKPEGLVIQSYTMTNPYIYADPSQEKKGQMKSVVHLAAPGNITLPCAFQCTAHSCTHTTGTPQPFIVTHADRETDIAINHYATKSEEEYNNKIARGDAQLRDYKYRRMWKELHTNCTTPVTTLLRYATEEFRNRVTAVPAE